MRKTFEQQLDEWLALPLEERIAIMSSRNKNLGILSCPEIDEVVDSPDYDIAFGDLPINKEI